MNWKLLVKIYMIFHGHPNYRQMGQWTDWVLVDWGAWGKLPCEIWCFVDLRSLTNPVVMEGETYAPGVHAMVESSRYMTEEEDGAQELPKSDLFRAIEKETQGTDCNGTLKRKFYLADVEAFLEPIAVVPDVGSMNKAKYFHVLARSQWATCFERWLHTPHVYDDMGNDDDQ